MLGPDWQIIPTGIDEASQKERNWIMGYYVFAFVAAVIVTILTFQESSPDEGANGNRLAEPDNVSRAVVDQEPQ